MVEKMNFDQLLTTDDIFENIVSPTDVVEFFRAHQKKLATAFENNDEPWLFYSNGDNCSIKCREGEFGNLPRQACLGCTMLCRLFNDCTYPKVAENAERAGLYKINDDLTVKIKRKKSDERERTIKAFVNNSRLAKILEPVDSGGIIMFCYECDDKIIFIEEVPRDEGFGFNGLLRLKNVKLFSKADYNAFIDHARKIDDLLYRGKYRLANYNSKYLAIERSANNQRYIIRIYGGVDDSINSPRGKIEELVSKSGLNC